VADAAAMRGAAPGDVPIAELDGALRATLPALRVSMHVFADDPDRRFAIVDGRRVREGDVLEGGLQVLAIRPEGLRLAWQGRVLWLPA
jgi:general secretion pathway protein B